MTYYGIGSESEATVLKREGESEERDIIDERNDNSFARELPVLKAGCTIYS